MSTHTALIVPEGTLTSDRRTIVEGALTWRENIPLMFQDRTTPGHDDAQHVGNATNLRRETVDGVSWIVADVEFDSDTDAREAMRLANEGKIAGVSADIGNVTAELEITEVDDEGFPVDWLETVTAGEIIGFTQLPMPAFAGAKIFPAGAALVAAANPRAAKSWFADPQLDKPTPLTVDDDGRIYGHLATWGTCHIGYDGVCVTPPESATGYKYFSLGTVNVEGEAVNVGHITLGTGHAQLSADATAATAHYDDTGACVADVACGEDEHGIWVAGACRPDADLDAVRSASLSGDWRRVDGNLELVAALAVNVPGFPIPRIAASVAHGDQLALVASGVVKPPVPKSDQELVADALRLVASEVRGLRDDLSAPEPVEPAAEVEPVTSGKLAKLLG